MKIKLLLSGAALLALLVVGIVAKNAYAGQCTTTCYGSGTYQTCNTSCW